MRVAFFLLFISSLSLSGQTIEDACQAFSERKKVRDGRFSFYAIDLIKGTPIVAHDIDRKMSPASTMKLLTTYAALDILGTDHRFRTRVGYSGNVDQEGRLQGDLIIESGGDPALDSQTFRKEYGNGAPIDRQILKAIRDAGIKSIAGRIIIDEQWYTGIDVPDEWTWQDMGNYYGAGAHAFTFRENRFKLYFNSGSKSGRATEIIKTDALLSSTRPINHVRSAAINSDQAYVYSAPHSDRMDVYGRIPLNKTKFEVKAAFPDPAAEFTAYLEQALDQAGIAYENKDLELQVPRNEDGSLDVQEILVFDSPPLVELVAYTNLTSNNLYAEHLLRQIGKARLGEGSFDKGIKALREWCVEKGLSTRGLLAKDGSGLSRANYVSTRFMVDLLTSLSKEPYYSEFKLGLPCAGTSGSMRRVGAGTAIAGHMYAKTGYIEGVRAYAGFYEKDGRSIAFSIMANDYDMSPSEMRRELTLFMVMLGN